jgi:hypothetical protein
MFRSRLTSEVLMMRGIVVAIAALTLAACGGSSGDEAAPQSTTTGAATSGDESSLEGWAQGLCSSVAEWQATTKSTGAKMANSKDDFAEGEQAVTSADDFLVSGLKGLGTAPAPASTDANDAIARLLTKLENESGEIEKALSGEPRTQSELVTASARVKALISEMNSDISKTVTELKSLPDTEGWKAAFDVPSCQGVATG